MINYVKLMEYNDKLPTNITHLRIVSSKNINYIVSKFVGSFLYFSSQNNPINTIFMEQCSLNNNDVKYVSSMISKRKSKTNLKGISFGSNPNISDKYINELLYALQIKAPKLKLLGLHGSKITNKSCQYIRDYILYCINNNGSIPQKIYLMRNKKINENGINILNDIYSHKMASKLIINASKCGQRSILSHWNTNLKVRFARFSNAATA